MKRELAGNRRAAGQRDQPARQADRGRWLDRRPAGISLRLGVAGERRGPEHNRLLQGPDAAVRERAAREWCRWEEAVVADDAGHSTSHDYDADPRAWLAFARICAHYFANAAWLNDGELLANASRLHSIPGVLVHGRRDLGGSPRLAWQMAQAWPNAELKLLGGAGHGSGPGMKDALVASLDRFAAAQDEHGSIRT